MRTRSTVTSASGKRESRLEILSVMAVELKKSSCKTNTDILIIQILQAVFRIRIKSGQWIRIRIRNSDPGGQNCPTKIEKS
jgi:hypothetical protein